MSRICRFPAFSFARNYPAHRNPAHHKLASTRSLRCRRRSVIPDLRWASLVEAPIPRRLGMRAMTIFSIMAATLAVLAISSVEARDMTSNVTVATPGRLAIISNSTIGHRVFVLDRFSSRFVTLHRRGFRRGFDGFGGALPLGFGDGLIGSDGVVDLGSPPVAIAASPNV